MLGIELAILLIGGDEFDWIGSVILTLQTETILSFETIDSDLRVGGSIRASDPSK